MTAAFDVSILIPVWNGGPYLAAAIDSALRQTLPPREIIVVDNGSTDETAAVIDRYRDCPTVRAIRNETNIGAVPNWQKAATLATGEYLSWLPADDLLLPTALARAADALAGRTDIGLYFSGYEMIDDGDRVIGTDRLERLGSIGALDRQQLLEFLFDRGQPNVVAGTLVRRTLFERLGGFDLALRGACDYDLFFRLAGNTAVFANPEVLVRARVHASQGSVAITHRDNGDPDRFFDKAGEYDFLSPDMRRRFVEALCEYARQYYHRPLRLRGTSARALRLQRETVRERLARWRDSGRPHARYVRMVPRKPLAALAWLAGATTPGAWLAGVASRLFSPRKLLRPEVIRIDSASEPPA